MRMRDDLSSAVMEAHRLASSRELWPGWDFGNTPLVLHSKEFAYTVGHPSPPEGYEEMEPVAGRAVHAGPLMPEMAANTVRTISGSTCALMMFSSTPLEDVRGFARLILHECFHAYQRKELSQVALPDYNVMKHYPENDPDNNAGSIVENRILCSALRKLSRSEDNETGSGIVAKATRADILVAAARFVVVRTTRLKRLQDSGHADICLYEQQSEFNEGTPTYVEVKAGKTIGELIHSLEKSNVGGRWAASRRFYATGAAIGLLLDILMPGWHERLAKGAHTMQSLLAEAVGPSVPDAAQVLGEEGYRDVLASEQANARERQARIDSMYREITSGSGVKLDIEMPDGAFTLFDPTNVIVVEPGVRLHSTISGLRGSHGIAVDITRLCLEDSKARLFTMRLPKAPEAGVGDETTLSGPGLKISAPEGFRRSLDPDGTYRVRFKT